jgi:hypothetical protein
MITPETEFCRSLLRSIMPEVRKRFPREAVRNAWAYLYRDGLMRHTGEFHVLPYEGFPTGYYWYGSASSIAEAKYAGWNAAINELNKREGHESQGKSKSKSA